MTTKRMNNNRRKKNGGGRGRPAARPNGGTMTVRRPPGAGSLDAQAAAYARLLANPCSAKLTHPLYIGGQGGYLFRAESDQIISTGAGEVGSMGFFCPGNCSVNALTTGTSTVAVVSDSVAQVLAGTSIVAPGKAFLQANAASVRCVSACLQITFPGTELNRSGIVGLGQSTYGRLAQLASSTAQLRTLSEKVRRMPDGMVEVRLVPTISSENYVNPNDTAAGLADMPALFWSVYGFPATVGIRVRMVAVYEWLPQQGEGLTMPAAGTTSESKNSLNDVLRALKGWGDWAYHGFEDAAGAVSSLYGAAGAGRALIRGTARAGQLLLA